MQLGQGNSTQGTFVTTVHADALGAPVMALSTAVEVLIAEAKFDRSHIKVIVRPFDTLGVRIFDEMGQQKWAVWSPQLVRVSLGGIAIGVSWSEADCTLMIASHVVSRASTGPLMHRFELHGRSAVDRTADWEKRSTRARRKRAVRGAAVLAQGSAAVSRLVTALEHRLANLEDAAAAIQQGKMTRILDIGANLRALLADGEGNGLLRRVAGFVDAPLPIYCDPRDPEARERRLAEDRHARSGFEGGSPLSATRMGQHQTMLDLDVWLSLRDWRVGAKTFSNEEALRRFGDTEAAHTDDDEHEWVGWMRRISGMKRHADDVEGTLLVEWLLQVTNVALSLGRQEVLPRTASLATSS